MSDTQSAGAVSTSLSVVYVTGVDSVELPGELKFSLRVKVFENRYQTYYTDQFAPDGNKSPTHINYTIIPVDRFIRVRASAHYTKFTIARPPAIATSGTHSKTAITPLPALGITFFDRILAQFGTGKTPVSTMVQNQDMAFFLRLNGYMRKNPLTMDKFWKMAGIYNFKSFDYDGGVFIAGAYTTNGYLGIDQNNPVLNGKVTDPYPGSIPMMGENVNKVQSPVYPKNMQPGQAVTPNVYDVPTKAMGGLWTDPAMQEYRSDFYGGYNTGGATATSYLTKMCFISPIYETPVTYPPVQQSYEFAYPVSQAQRPRVINTPYVVPQATGGTGAVVLNDLVDQATYTGVTLDTNQCYFMQESVAFRPDIHSAILTAWSKNQGMVDYFESYDWFTQGNVQSSPLSIPIVQQGNAVGYMARLFFRLQYPLSTLDNTANQPAAINFCPYVFGEQRFTYMRAYTSSPINLTLNDDFYNTGNTRPPSYDMAQRLYTAKKGILDGYNNWYEPNLETGFYTNPSFDDINSKTPRDDCLNYQMPPMGSCDTAGAITYGSHSAYFAADPNNGWNIGCHDQYKTFVYAQAGLVSETEDFGSMVGSLRFYCDFPITPPSPLIFDHLMAYSNSLTMIGTGVAVTFIPIR